MLSPNTHRKSMFPPTWKTLPWTKVEVTRVTAAGTADAPAPNHGTPCGTGGAAPPGPKREAGVNPHVREKRALAMSSRESS